MLALAAAVRGDAAEDAHEHEAEGAEDEEEDAPRLPGGQLFGGAARERAREARGERREGARRA